MYVRAERYPGYIFFIGILELQKHLKTKQHLESFIPVECYLFFCTLPDHY